MKNYDITNRIKVHPLNMPADYENWNDRELRKELERLDRRIRRNYPYKEDSITRMKEIKKLLGE